MAAFDLFGRRWTLRVVWELDQASAPVTFRDLRSRCGDISSSVLTRRLSELADAAIVTHTGKGYVLTDLGGDLVQALSPLIDWSRAWERALGHD